MDIQAAVGGKPTAGGGMSYVGAPAAMPGVDPAFRLGGESSPVYSIHPHRL